MFSRVVVTSVVGIAEGIRIGDMNDIGETQTSSMRISNDDGDQSGFVQTKIMPSDSNQLKQPLLPSANEKGPDAKPAGPMTVDDLAALFGNVPETDRPYFVGCPIELKVRKFFERIFWKSGQLRTRYIGWFSFGADRFWGIHFKSNLIR